MSTTVEIEARVLGRRSAGLEPRSLQLGDLPPTPTLRELIEAVVRAEVRSFHQRVEDRRFTRFLTEPEIVNAVADGKVAVGDTFDGVATHADPDAAVATALLAHADGLFQVVVNGTPVDEQDDLIDVGEGTHLLFVRLVALAGG